MRAAPLLGGYGAAKAALNGIVRSIAVEWGASNIRANAIAPSMIDTDIFQGQLSEARREEVRRSIPLGRLGRAGDVAGVCLFLASDLSCYVTGAVIDVNGGSHIH